MQHMLENLLVESGWPKNNDYSFDVMAREFLEYNITLSRSAFDIAVKFDGISLDLANLHKNMVFNIKKFIKNYKGYLVDEVADIVGKSVIPFALDEGSGHGGYMWCVDDVGQVYTAWADVICLMGGDIITALEEAFRGGEGHLIS